MIRVPIAATAVPVRPRPWTATVAAARRAAVPDASSFAPGASHFASVVLLHIES